MLFHLKSDRTETDLNPLNIRLYQPVTYNNFCVLPYLFRSYERKENIPMMLHATPDLLNDKLLKTLNSWDGRAVLAVYSDSSIRHPMHLKPTIEQTIQKLQQIYHCNPKLYDFLSVHVFYLQTSNISCTNFEINFAETINCNRIFQLDSINFKPLLEYYPVNVARNIARKFDNSEYFLQADLEQVFSKDAEKLLQQVISKYSQMNNRRVVFIVPRFEYEIGSRIPKTVKELSIVYGKTTFQFHGFTFAEAHNVTNIDNWIKKSIQTDQLISEITNYEDHNTTTWEPMFLSHASLPLHHEEIPYGMRNQATLISQLCCLGYKFVVVNKVFNTHPGVRRIPFRRLYSLSLTVKAKKALENYHQNLLRTYGHNAEVCLGYSRDDILHKDHEP